VNLQLDHFSDDFKTFTKKPEGHEFMASHPNPKTHNFFLPLE